MESPINVLSSPYFRDFIKKSFDNNLQSFFSFCKDISLNAINEIFSELKGKKRIEFDKKLDSLMAELYAMEYFASNGCELLKRSERQYGSCNWLMCKDSLEYNIEVKVKESRDTALNRL